MPALVVADPRAVLGARRRARLRHPGRAPADDRDHRHQRQDHHRLPRRARPGAPSGRATGLIGTVETRIGDERVKSVRTTPGGDRPARAARRHARARRRRLRDGGLQPRAGPAPGRRRRLRRRRLHQPRPRTTSTSTPTMEDYFAPRRRCSPRARAPRRRLRRRRVGPAAGGRRRPCRVVTVTSPAGRRDADWRRRATAERRRPARRSRCAGAATGCTLRLAPLPGDFNVANTRSPPSRCCRGGLDAARRRAAVLAEPRRARPDGAVVASDGATALRWCVVDYAHTPDAVDAALRRPAPLTDGPAHRRARRRRRPRPRQAAGDGRSRGARLPTSSSSPTTTPAPRTRPRSAPPCSRARGGRRHGARRGASRSADRRAAIARGRRVALRRAGRHRAGRRQGPRDRPGGRRASCTRSTTATCCAQPCASRQPSQG